MKINSENMFCSKNQETHAKNISMDERTETEKTDQKHGKTLKKIKSLK